MTEPYYADDRVTLYLSDCREVTEWLAADVLVTDPPYGMAYDSGWVKGRKRPIANDTTTEVRDAAIALWGDKPAAVFGTWREARPTGMRHLIVWDKTDGVGPGMGDLTSAFGTSHEEVYLLGAWPKQSRVPRQGSVIRSAISMSEARHRRRPSDTKANCPHGTPYRGCAARRDR